MARRDLSGRASGLVAACAALLALAAPLGLAGCIGGASSAPGEPRARAAGERSLRFITYNVYYVFSRGTEVEAGSAWIASQEPDVVALQELTNISEARLAELAAGWDHDHSALLKTSGFSVGLTSVHPIEVVERALDGFHHGCLHARVSGIDVFVVHLSPFKWSVREREAEAILSRVEPLLDERRDVVVLGDFNALSGHDSIALTALPEQLEKARWSDAEHGHVENLRDGEFDFAVMQSFFDAGLVDQQERFLDRAPGARWTFTTGIWSEEKRDAPEGGTRIDYVLASPEMAARARCARVVREGVVNRTSDHYPVIVDFDGE
ncbi:MAG: endonuclease/exonuclease/phosphatase family protein [Planctomycetota bacterium]|nr:endonuclease/exonuclease/phosphatase family protein [Planctomycetota bacterium]